MNIQELLALFIIAIILLRAGYRLDNKANRKNEPLIFPLIIAAIIGLALYIILSWSAIYLACYGMSAVAVYYLYYRHQKEK